MKSAALWTEQRQLSSAVFVLALLVGKAAGGLASGLAGRLAFAAAAGAQALGQVAGLQGLDSLHEAQLLSGS